MYVDDMKDSCSGNDRICNCHFLNGDKSKDPVLFLCNEGKQFDFPDPEIRTRLLKILLLLIELNECMCKLLILSNSDVGLTRKR